MAREPTDTFKRAEIYGNAVRAVLVRAKESRRDNGADGPGSGRLGRAIRGMAFRDAVTLSNGRFGGARVRSDRFGPILDHPS